MPGDSAKKPLVLCISLDVEEEGLFSGHYPRNGSVENVAQLPRLAPLWQELGIPVTLLCTHSVFASPKARKILEQMRDGCNAEIGAHLHHWSTPPFEGDDGPPIRSTKLDRNLLHSRLQKLFDAGQEFQGAPLRSFRMGRWDLASSWRPILEDFGILVDSSICPLRKFAAGPDHFSAPADPYWVAGKTRRLLEAPITQIAPLKFMPKLWKLAFGNSRFMDAWHYFGAVSANPFWHGTPQMRLAAKLHALRGGKVLNLFWHSSEMLPGASPHVPDQASADARLAKIFAFCRWLMENFQVRAVTMQNLYELDNELNFADYSTDCTNGDW